MRAVRAAVVVPALFALADKVIKDPQLALFATFGGFATLVIASFSGTRKDKLVAHAGLAVAGSLVLIIGTLVSGTTWLAAVVTVPVAFAIFFAGVGGPNAASASTAVMFAYVLPVASAGGAGTIPSRLEGWWLASAVGTAAVLLLSPASPGDRVRASAAALAGELADRVAAAANRSIIPADAMQAARDKLRAAFTAAPFRPTGLATADQALASLVQLLDWGAAQAADAFDGHVDMTKACAPDRELLAVAARLFADTKALLSGQQANPDFDAIEAARARSAAELRDRGAELMEVPDDGADSVPSPRVAAAHAVHAQAIAVVARGAAAEALVASRRASPEDLAAERRQWYGELESPGHAGTAIGRNGSGVRQAVAGSPRAAGVSRAVFLLSRHASIRSVWFLNSLRGAVALAAAVAVADLSSVQHGFWVVLGTLSVLRTSAAATGATAWRALAGTVIGFVVGAGLLAAVGTGQDAMWAVLPVAVFVAAYAPGTMPFLVGQAAFTVTIVVLFNILVPAGWKVGLLRVEDVAIGCAVSFLVGVLFWPRGASTVVADDLAESFKRGAEYLVQAVDWALSELMVPPAAALAASSASIRLDDAVRGFLTEQGSKRLAKEDLWALVNASTRLRLSAHTLAGLRVADAGPGIPVGIACLPLAGSETYAGLPACVGLRMAAADLAGFYGQVADEVARPGRNGELALIPAPAPTGPAVPRPGSGDGHGADGHGADGHGANGHGADGHGADADGVAGTAQAMPHPHLLWVQEHLHHLSASAQTVSAPALRLAEVRRRPWWR
jgi:uncharacterized membrane protein YccC